jgi:hypothetical protein
LSSAVFPRFDQLGFVVHDAGAAMRHWLERMGVGPFFVAERISMPGFTYRGTPSAPVLTLAIAYWGPVQVELIEQHNDAPSGYRDFLRAGREGLQHMAVFTADAEADKARCLAAGMTVQHEGLSPFDRVTRFCYLETGGHPGTVLELVQMTPAKAARFRAMQEAAAGWTGEDPIRRF